MLLWAFAGKGCGCARSGRISGTAEWENCGAFRDGAFAGK